VLLYIRYRTDLDAICHHFPKLLLGQ
jgi:hypothetical protein